MTGAVVAYPDETLREIANRMAGRRVSALPVVDRADSGKVLGIIVMEDLLQGRLKDLQAERDAERALKIERLWGGRTSRSQIEEIKRA